MKLQIDRSDVELTPVGTSPLMTAIKRETGSRFATFLPDAGQYGTVRATRGSRSRYFKLSQRAKNYLRGNKTVSNTFVLEEV